MRVPIWAGSNGAAAASSRPSQASSSDLRTIASPWRLRRRVGRAKRCPIGLAPAEPRLDREEPLRAVEAKRPVAPPFRREEQRIDLGGERQLGRNSRQERADRADEALGDRLVIALRL